MFNNTVLGMELKKPPPAFVTLFEKTMCYEVCAMW